MGKVGAQKDFYVVGIDPGLRGGIAILDQSLAIRLVAPMPLRESNLRKYPNARQLAEMLSPFVLDCRFVVIEDVHAMPNQSISAMFNFGFGAGILTGVCETLGVPTLKLAPSAWKAQLGLSKDKTRSFDKVRALWPREAPQMALKHDGVAEALLLAYLGVNRFLDVLKGREGPPDQSPGGLFG